MALQEEILRGSPPKRQHGTFAITQDEASYELTRGRFFSGSHYVSALVDDASIELLLQVGSIKMYARVHPSVSGNSELRMFENPTFSDAGTAVNVSNNSRISLKTFPATLTHTPTVSNDGDSIDGTVFIPGGTKTGGSGSVAGGFSSFFVLAPNKNYLIRLTNVSGGNSFASLLVSGYFPELEEV